MYRITRLCEEDYYCGYLQLLEQLTTVESNKISYKDFCTRLNEINSIIFVIKTINKIIACGSIFIEKKFIHHLGYVGHIEDIVVDKDYRKKGLGRMIINKLTEYNNNAKFQYNKF